MKRTRMRRQALKIVAGMALSPWPLPSVSAQADRVQQTVTALLAVTEEGSILQIDQEDLRDTLKLCGSSPVSFTVTKHDADKVLDACRDALARIGSIHRRIEGEFGLRFIAVLANGFQVFTKRHGKRMTVDGDLLLGCGCSDFH